MDDEQREHWLYRQECERTLRLTLLSAVNDRTASGQRYLAERGATASAAGARYLASAAEQRRDEREQYASSRNGASHQQPPASSSVYANSGAAQRAATIAAYSRPGSAPGGGAHGRSSANGNGGGGNGHKQNWQPIGRGAADAQPIGGRRVPASREEARLSGSRGAQPQAARR